MAMRALYNIVFTFFFVLSAPYYFWKMWRRGNWRTGFLQRFGRYESPVKHAVTNRQVLWIHAVSVGEVGLCVELVRALETRLPNLKIVVSTTTSTGMGTLQRRLPGRVEKIYYPIDFKSCVSKALASLHPRAVMLVEAEIWPNFLWRLHDRRTPVFLVNARLSERSYRGYRRLSFLFRPLFASFEGVGAPDARDAARLVELGCRPDAVQVIGNLKYDTATLDERRPLDVPGILAQLGVAPTAPIWVAGSTHPGEEAVLARVFLRLRPQHPDLFLILVPRHFERGREVGRELQAAGVKFVYRREITAVTRHPPNSVQCLLVNTTGELKHFYEAATLVFVGKSLVGMGGQNPIEPAALGKPLLFGPNMQNFESIAHRFVAAGGAVRVSDEAELEQAVHALLADEPRRVRLGQTAVEVVRNNTGALGRTVEMVARYCETDRS